MGFKRIKNKWFPDHDLEVVEIIASPNVAQVSAFYSDRYSDIFPGFDDEEDEISFYSHVEPPLLIHSKKSSGGLDPLPPGIYVSAKSDFDFALKAFPVYPDKYVALYNGHSALLEDVENFFAAREKYKALEISHRRGALLYGPPGNGKTRMAIEVARKVIELGGVVILYTKSISGDLIDLGKALSGQPCVFIIEELSAQGDMEVLLSFLDGEESWDNVYTIATTNYPETLETNIVDRPGRFDLLQEFSDPDRKQREAYLLNFLDKVPEKLLADTEGYSVAYLKYMVAQHLIYGQPFETIIDQMMTRKATVKANFTKRKDGFAF